MPREDPDTARTLPDPRVASPSPHAIADPDAELIPLAPQERYETRQALGEGGMGEVRLASDRLIGRDVAMKLVRAEHAMRADARARFVREVRVQGQLEHPAIVPVYDFGIDGRGDAFFTMRRVRGSTLADILEALARGDEDARKEHTRHKLLGAFVRVCLAISYAHERGVIHRDLKPANVMIGGFGEVYVLDWGLAKVRGASRSVEPPASHAQPDVAGVSGTETAAGSLIGTPAYMAPEQVRGEDVDARTDIYALGAILFELLTLEPLHGDGTPAAVLARIVRGIEGRASVRTPHRAVPPELEAICVKATAPARNDRHASARELADAVDAYLAGDRDAELRKDLARAHLGRAKAAVQTDDRPFALSEVGRALALAPSDPEALALLVKLLTEPPREVPADVRRAMDRTAIASQHRMLLPAAGIYFLGWASFIPLQAAIGIRHWPLALMPLAAFAATSALVVLAWRAGERRRARILRAASIASWLSIALSSTIYGVFLALPAFVAINAMGMMLVTAKARRSTAIAGALGALLVPIGLAWVDLHPVRHVFDGDRLTILSGTIAMPRDATMAALSITYVIVIGVAAMFAARYRDALERMQLANELSTWQLRQLVPDQGLKSMRPAPPP